MDFGNMVSVYRCEQAIEDGVLVHPFPEQCPWLLLTSAVHNAIEAIDDGRTYAQKVIPLMLDAVNIAKAKPKEGLWTKGLEGNITQQTIWIALNEKGGLTLMFPEDY